MSLVRLPTERTVAMAPKHGPAPTLVGDRVLNLIILVQDETEAQQLQHNPRFLETIARSFNCYQCDVVTSVGVRTVFDAVDGRRVVLNEEIRHVFDDVVWQSFVDAQDFGEVGYMVAVMHCLRLQRALSDAERQDHFALFVDARVMKPDEQTFDLFRAACQQRLQSFRTPPAMVALGATMSRSMLPAARPMPKGWQRAEGPDSGMAWSANNKNIGLQDVRGKCCISAEAVLLHCKTMQHVLDHGFQATTLEESWYMAAQLSTKHNWKNGAIMSSWPPAFVTSGVLSWEGTCAPRVSRLAPPGAGEDEALLVELTDYCGFSNRLHIMTAAMAAAHFAGMHLVVMWDPSAHCPTSFHDCWHVRQPMPAWIRCRGLHIVGKASDEAQELRERFHLQRADMTGFATCDVLLRELHSQVRQLLLQDSKPPPEPLDDTLLALWHMWQPAPRCWAAAEEYVAWVKEDSGCELVAGVHYRRGDLKALMLKTYGKTGCQAKQLDYTRYDQEFLDDVRQMLEEGYAVIVCTDTVAGLQFWSTHLPGAQNLYFNTRTRSHELPRPGSGKQDLRQTSHEQFTTDLCQMMQCDRFLGTSESTVRHVVMYGRQLPFAQAKVIGLAPWGFRHLTGQGVVDIRNLAVRIAPRWSATPTRGSCEWLSLSDEHVRILADLHEQAVVDLWDTMMKRMMVARDPSVHGSWLGAMELPPSIEAARREWKAVSQAADSRRRGRRPAGFLSAVTWTRMREWCMSQGETCPLSWGDRFILVARENLMADMTLMRMLGHAQSDTVTFMNQAPEEVVETPGSSSTSTHVPAAPPGRGQVPFPPKAMQIAVSRPKWAATSAAPEAKRPRK